MGGADGRRWWKVHTGKKAVFGIIAFVGGANKSIDSAKMKRKQTSLIPFLAKENCQGKAIYVYD